MNKIFLTIIGLSLAACVSSNLLSSKEEREKNIKALKEKVRKQALELIKGFEQNIAASEAGIKEVEQQLNANAKELESKQSDLAKVDAALIKHKKDATLTNLYQNAREEVVAKIESINETIARLKKMLTDLNKVKKHFSVLLDLQKAQPIEQE